MLRSKIFWALFNKIPDRHTIGCSQNYDTSQLPLELNQELVKKVNKKMVLMVDRMRELSQKHNFKLIVTFVEGQSAYILHKDVNYQFINNLKLVSLKKAGLDVIVSEDIMRRVNSVQSTVDETIASTVLGASVENLDTKLFLEEPDFPYGSKHMNEVGNQLFAEVIAERI